MVAVKRDATALPLQLCLMALLAGCSFDLSRPPPGDKDQGVDTATVDSAPPDSAPPDAFVCKDKQDCDDKLTCTDDSCDKGVCNSLVQPGKCLIDAACHDSGQTSKTSIWKSCHPKLDQLAWTVLGNVITFAGKKGAPNAADGNLTTATFWAPYALSMDAAGTIYVGGGGSFLVREIKKDAKQQWMVKTLAGTLASSGFADGPADQAKFNSPTGVVADANGDVFVTDTNNHRIRKIDRSKSPYIVSTYAGSGTSGYVGGKLATAQFDEPIAISYDSLNNRFYVADRGNDAIRIVDSVDVSTTVADHKTLKKPRGVYFDGKDTVYIADSGNHCIRKLKQNAVEVIAGTCGKYGDQDGPAKTALFSGPRNLAVAPTGEIFITDTDNNKIKIVVDGQVYSLAGKAGAGDFLDGVGDKARFNGPRGICTDGKVVYIADFFNHLIRKITPAKP